MGVLFLTDEEDQQLWLSGHPYHAQDIFYGILFMVPALFLFDFRGQRAKWAYLYGHLATAASTHNYAACSEVVCREFGLERFADMTHLLNILYLGLGASALCFVTWNLAVKALGAVKTSVYIYMVPVITVVTSVLVLKEPVMWVSAVGTVLAVAGLFLSEYNGKGSGKDE